MKGFYWFALVIAAVLGAILFALLKSPPPGDSSFTKKTSALASPPIAATPAAERRSSAPETKPRPAAVPDPEALNAKMHALQARGVWEMQLRIAEARAKLTLSDPEHQRLLDDVLDFQHAEAVIDGPFIKVGSFDGATLVLEIPAHAEQGAAVKSTLTQQIRQEFSPEHADQIVAALDTNFEALFDGFGQFSQTYTIEKPRPDGQIHVTRVAAPPEADGTGDPAALQKARALGNDGWFDREVLDLAHEVVVPTVNTYFPADATQPEPAHVP